MTRSSLVGASKRAVLFDLDGTLADTAADLARALNRLLVERGRKPVPPELTRPHTSSGARGLIGVGFGITPGDGDYEQLRARFLDFYAEDICVETRLYDGMPELLSRLEGGNIRWGVVTNKPARFTVPLMEKLGLSRRAACIVSGDTAPRAKPHPDSLLHATRELGLQPQQCLYVGDDLRDVQAARAAGMPVVAAGFGYLGDGGDPETWGADDVIAGPLEVLDHLT
jgi:phosphoglycolate phosphatase